MLAVSTTLKVRICPRVMSLMWLHHHAVNQLHRVFFVIFVLWGFWKNIFCCSLVPFFGATSRCHPLGLILDKCVVEGMDVWFE